MTEEALNFCEGVQDLDDIDVVNEVVLICVCPFLNELNALLTGSSAHTARHVRPTPTKPSGNPVKQLEVISKFVVILQLDLQFLAPFGRELSSKSITIY